MGAFTTKDPSKGFGAGTLFTGDPSKGFGAGTLFKSVPTEELTVEQMERRRKSGAIPAGTKMKKGGKVSSTSKRADGIAQRGKTRGTMC